MIDTEHPWDVYSINSGHVEMITCLEWDQSGEEQTLCLGARGVCMAESLGFRFPFEDLSYWERLLSLPEILESSCQEEETSLSWHWIDKINNIGSVNPPVTPKSCQFVQHCWGNLRPMRARKLLLF